jgi:hypothetical protein
VGIGKGIAEKGLHLRAGKGKGAACEYGGENAGNAEFPHQDTFRDRESAASGQDIGPRKNKHRNG